MKKGGAPPVIGAPPAPTLNLFILFVPSFLFLFLFLFFSFLSLFFPFPFSYFWRPLVTPDGRGPQSPLYVLTPGGTFAKKKKNTAPSLLPTNIFGFVGVFTVCFTLEE